MPIYRANDTAHHGDDPSIPKEPLAKYRKAEEEVLNKNGIEIFDIIEQIGKAEGNPVLFPAAGLERRKGGHSVSNIQNMEGSWTASVVFSRM